MPPNTLDIPVNKVNESINTVNSTLSGFQKSIIDDNLDKLDFSQKIPDLMDKVNTLLNINLFGLWTARSLLGVQMFDKEKYKKKWWIFNFIFKKYGGIEWLHKSYIEQTLTKFFGEQPDKKTTISTLYALYQQNKQNNISPDVLTGADSINIVCNLWFNEKTPQIMIDKLPQTSFSYLSKTVKDGIVGKEAHLDPNILAGLWCVVPKKVWPNGVEIIDTSSPDWKPEMITSNLVSQYLKEKISEFSKTPSYIKDIPSSDHFVFSLMGGLFVNGNVFAESVLIGVSQPEKLWIEKNIAVSSPENLDVVNWKIDFAAGNFSPEQIKNINSLIDEMTARGIKNPYTQVGILSVISKESWFVPKSEFGYQDTPNARIRELFTTRVAKYSETELDVLKKDPQKFFEVIYGKDATKDLWWATGNTEPWDGYLYRGRGFNQLTFKANYQKYGKIIGEDLVASPDRANDPLIASKLVLAFFAEWSKGKDLWTLNFADKAAAVKYFADINAGGYSSHLSKAIAASEKFDIQEKTVA